MTDTGPIIALCTDFGVAGPYLGQMRAVLYRDAPHARVIDLFSDLPAYNAMAAAYLLPAYAADFPLGTVFLCVVDPGVGDVRRRPVVVKADGRWFVGPENGLFELIVRRAGSVEYWCVTWRPQRLSSTFHGRDLFAPVAALLARGEPPPGEASDPPAGDSRWPDDLARVVYIDHFGNAMTGLRFTRLADHAVMAVNGVRLAHAATFSEMPLHQAFWYENANGLVEIAVNQGCAADILGIAVGDSVEIIAAGPQ
jgi:S-adenosylmethionine hydrolase